MPCVRPDGPVKLILILHRVVAMLKLGMVFCSILLIHLDKRCPQQPYGVDGKDALNIVDRTSMVFSGAGK